MYVCVYTCTYCFQVVNRSKYLAFCRYSAQFIKWINMSSKPEVILRTGADWAKEKGKVSGRHHSCSEYLFICCRGGYFRSLSNCMQKLLGCPFLYLTFLNGTLLLIGRGWLTELDKNFTGKGKSCLGWRHDMGPEFVLFPPLNKLFLLQLIFCLVTAK